MRFLLQKYFKDCFSKVAFAKCVADEDLFSMPKSQSSHISQVNSQLFQTWAAPLGGSSEPMDLDEIFIPELAISTEVSAACVYLVQEVEKRIAAAKETVLLCTNIVDEVLSAADLLIEKKRLEEEAEMLQRLEDRMEQHLLAWLSETPEWPRDPTSAQGKMMAMLCDIIIDDAVQARVVELSKFRYGGVCVHLIPEEEMILHHLEGFDGRPHDDDRDIHGRLLYTKTNYLYLIVQEDFDKCKAGVTKVQVLYLLMRYRSNLAKVHFYGHFEITNGTQLSNFQFQISTY